MKAKSSKTGQGGKGCFTIMWCLVSAIFVGVGVLLLIKGLREKTWIEVPCQIETLEITSTQGNDQPFTIRTRFTFEHEGQRYMGDRFSTRESRDSNYEDLYEKLQASRAQSTCHFDPENPEKAALQKSPATIVAGAVLTAIATLILLAGLLSYRRSDSAKKPSSASSKSIQKTSKAPLILFAFFFLFGLIPLLLFSLPSYERYQAAKSWPTVPATVIWSQVRSHSSDDGTTYSPDIFYRYTYEGNEYRSNRYKFTRVSSSGHRDKEAIVARYPDGHEFQVHVNPKKPWRAVIEPKMGWGLLLILLPTPFLLVGMIGLWKVLTGGNRPRPAEASSRSNALPERMIPIKPSLGTGKGGRIGKFVGHLLLALFWNGIVSIFVFQAVKDWQQGSPEWFLMIFIIPFVLIGLAIFGSLPHSLLAIFSPYFSFDLSPREIVPGTRLTAKWAQTGGSGTVRQMTLTLIGEEVATYQQGTDTQTAKSTFHRQILKESTRRDEILAGQVEFVLPADALPSFASDHNEIRWFLHHHVDVVKRPDVKDDISLTVQPFTESDYR